MQHSRLSVSHAPCPCPLPGNSTTQVRSGHLRSGEVPPSTAETTIAGMLYPSLSVVSPSNSFVCRNRSWPPHTLSQSQTLHTVAAPHALSQSRTPQLAATHTAVPPSTLFSVPHTALPPHHTISVPHTPRPHRSQPSLGPRHCAVQNTAARHRSD
eukprot:2169340-Rhodomonas_salina.1